MTLCLKIHKKKSAFDKIKKMPKYCQNKAQVKPHDIKSSLSNLKKTLEDVPSCNILNYDKTNLTDDLGRKQFIYTRGTRYPERRMLNSTKSSVSLMFSGTGKGLQLGPYVVYKAESMWITWTEGGPSARYNRSKSGWFEETTFTDWFKTIVVTWACCYQDYCCYLDYKVNRLS